MRLHDAHRGLSVAGIPLSFGRRVVVALSLEARWLGPVRAVEIAVSHDAGHSFAVEALRPVGWCPNEGGLHGLFAPPRAAIVGPTTWWIFGAVGGRPTLEITGDAGRTWHSEHPSRLPPWPCSLVAVSVAGPRDVLGLVAATPEDSQRGRYFLMATHDGGDSWRPVRLP
jgi:hypothetical protein